jgi:hypothetical protein
MLARRIGVRLRLLPALALSLAALVACGDDGTTFVDEDPPPGGGEGGFDPGPSPNGASSGAGYGYGANSGTSTTSASSSASAAESASSSSAGTGGEPPPECDDADKRCAHLFTYESSAASSVEVRGDFAPGAWDDGVPMEQSGATWSVEIPLPWGEDVHYKFFVDGSQYFTDPANPQTVDDGFGGLNSVLDGQTCPDSFTCAED